MAAAGKDVNDKRSQPSQLIQPIPPQAIQRIVAGQAITDLSSAVKELVDNAIDAGSHRVTIKLYDRGLEAIEVSDNGHGVPPDSRPYMAMKHATSKLRNFDDLYTNSSNGSSDENIDRVQRRENHNTSDEDCAPTLGFRGEALFCLANISRSLIVSTRSAEDNDNNDDNKSKLGEQFEFDSNGHIIPSSIKRIQLSQLTGTTVTVRGLFERLPVRRVDMCKRIKLQRMKLMKMMQGYAILCLGTQFNVTDINMPSNNDTSRKTCKQKTEVRLATSESSKTLESRVASVLGTKFLTGLTQIDVDLCKAGQSSSTSTNDENTKSDIGSHRWKVQGLISHSPTSPHSANARDLQFFGINGRPVDLPSVSRLLSDVWRMFDPTSAEGETNTGQRRRPACILAFTLPNNMYDVNLSPDKREVMFTEEAAISELMREGLMELWSSQSDGKFEANEVESRSKNKEGGRDRECKIADHHDSQDDGNMKLTQRNHKMDEVKGVTPKLSRTSISNGPIVTPMDSEGQIPNKDANSPDQLQFSERGISYDEKAGDRDDLPPIPQQDVAEQTDTNDNKSKREAQVSWMHDRSQNRRNWNQAQINFQRIQKTEVWLEGDRILSPHDDSVNDQRDDNHRPAHDLVSRRSASKPTIINRSLDADVVMTDRFTPRRQPKRQKLHSKQDVTSFLDGFAYGSANHVAKDCEIEDNDDSDELEQPEKNSIVDVFDSRRVVLKTGVVRNTRMAVGKIVTENMPPQSATHNVRAMDIKRIESHHHNDVESGKWKSRKSPPMDVVWNSFSGTQKVIAQSQCARLMMRNARKYIQSSLKRKGDDIHYQDVTGITASDVVASGKGESVDLCKEDFLHMSIIGQFNLGFILARCRNHNLWILDQHACDEKFNFEKLCKETIIHEQKLIAPLSLDLSPSEEHCVLEHMDDFERNGFRFSYDPEKGPRHRLSLTALPHSGSGGDGKKAVQFGKEDVGALCAMLGADGTTSSVGYNAGFSKGTQGGRVAGVNAVRRYAGLAGGVSYQGGGQFGGVIGSTIVRLPKAIAMFASRACRGSIMIGTALSQKEQLNIMKKLDKCDVPWNCAHGRPTMSHIRDLTNCLISDNDVLALHVAGPNLSLMREE